jgi:hypothetical protein
LSEVGSAQVSRRSKHPLSTGHTCCEPSSMILNTELSTVCQSQSAKYGLIIGMKMKVCSFELDHCNGHRIFETLTSNETAEIPVTSSYLSVVYPDSKTDRM